MKTFTSPEQLASYLKRHLKARAFSFDSQQPDMVIRFTCNSQRYRFNASAGLLEREAPPHYLESDHATRAMFERINSVRSPKPKPSTSK